jgi:putative hydrolase of HD superfamily
MNTDKTINFFFEIASLRRIIRSHCQLIQSANDNISDHSFRVTIIGMILAEMEKCDVNKVIKMCLFHDLQEARTGDANVINKQYLKLERKQALKDQLKNLPIEKEILQIIEEYENKKSRESIVTKDADLLDQMILQQEYFYADQKNKKIWQAYSLKDIKTKSAKKLAQKIEKSNPFEWEYVLYEEKTKEKIKR